MAAAQDQAAQDQAAQDQPAQDQPAQDQPAQERVYVVTGASAGVGRAVVRRLAGPGVRIGLLARGPDRLEAARIEVEAAGGRALAVPTDVADPAAVEAAAEAIEAALGPIDVWINNAMVTVFAPVWDVEPDEYARVMAVTCLGVVHGTQAALRRMRPRRRGAIVQVGSALAHRGIPLQSAYCAAKHAVQGFTESLRVELMHEGLDIRLTIVHLPALNTPQFEWLRSRLPNKPQPVPPIFQPEVAAEAIAFAAEHDRRQMYVGWPVVKTIWGNRLAPWLADRVLARSGFSDQQRDAPDDAGRPDNLFEPVPGDFAARGAFDDRATGRSAVLWMSMHRGLVAALAALAVIIALALALG